MLLQGYESHPWIKQELRRLSTVSLPMALLYAFTDLAIILLLGIAAVTGLSRIPLALWIPLYVLLTLPAARQMRGLECLVHEASHYNWVRKHRLNDNLANMLAAWPVLSQVATYRKTHLLHHLRLGTDADTDLIRWRQLKLHELDRNRPIAFMIGLAKRIVPYVPGWWWAIGVDPATITRFALWHVLLIGLIAAFTFSVPTAVLIWVFGWLIPLFVVLPVIRFIGELEEHNYPLTSVIESTNTNIGVVHRLLIHPHGDGYHTLHHIFPTIPFFRIGAVHRHLMAVDPDYASKVPIRYRVLG